MFPEHYIEIDFKKMAKNKHYFSPLSDRNTLWCGIPNKQFNHHSTRFDISDELKQWFAENNIELVYIYGLRDVGFLSSSIIFIFKNKDELLKFKLTYS